MAEFLPDNEVRTYECLLRYHRGSGKAPCRSYFLSGQGASCHVNMAADKTLELGRVNDLAFNAPASNRIQIVHYLQAELKRILQAFAYPCHPRVSVSSELSNS